VEETDLESLVAKAIAGDRDAAWDLANRGKLDASAVGPRVRDLFRAGVLSPPDLYLGSDDSVRADLVAAIDRGFPNDRQRLDRALLALAYARGNPAEGAFRRWRQLPPPGAEGLHLPAADYTVQAGWVLAPESGTRSLCGSEAYRLDVVDGGEGADPGVSCPLCSSPMWVVIDIDWVDPRVASGLAHTGWNGKLRVVTCQFCACYGELFNEVTQDGASRWSDLTQRPGFLPASQAEAPSRPAFAVGGPRPGPYMASAWDKGGSTLGGFPDWIQEARYMKCPRCQEYMDHVALIGGADVSSLGEGAYYIGLHAPCQIAGVNYQQS
jgi:hypothetical protein